MLPSNTNAMRRRIIAVVGAAECTPSELQWQLAYTLGEQLVLAGYRVLTGGLGGVMEAALAGAHIAVSYAEGDTLAILPGFSPESANSYADLVIATGIDAHMNALVANSDAVIAIGGGAGTLCEIAMAWERNRPVLVYHKVDGSSAHVMELHKAADCHAQLYPVATAQQAVGTLSQLWKEADAST